MKNITKIYITLLLLTTFSFLTSWFKIINYYLIFILLLTTFLKGQLIIDYFMNLKEVKLKYRILPIIWLSVVIILIGLAYYFPA